MYTVYTVRTVPRVQQAMPRWWCMQYAAQITGAVDEGSDAAPRARGCVPPRVRHLGGLRQFSTAEHTLCAFAVNLRASSHGDARSLAVGALRSSPSRADGEIAAGVVSRAWRTEEGAQQGGRAGGARHPPPSRQAPRQQRSCGPGSGGGRLAPGQVLGRVPGDPRRLLRVTD